MPEAPFENDCFCNIPEPQNENREIEKMLKNIHRTRRWLRNTFIGIGALLGLAGVAMVTGYVYFNSEHYKISRLTPKEMERIRWRSSWVEHGIDDPCKMMRRNQDNVSQMDWKCHEFFDPPSLDDLPPLPSKIPTEGQEKNRIDSGSKSNNPPKRRVKEFFEA